MENKKGRKHDLESVSTDFHPMSPIREFLLEDAIFNHRVIADRIGVHRSAISLFLSGRSTLAEKHTKKLIKLMKGYGFENG